MNAAPPFDDSDLLRHFQHVLAEPLVWDLPVVSHQFDFLAAEANRLRCDHGRSMANDYFWHFCD